MSINERITIAEFAVRYPYIYVAVLNMAWGAAYSALLAVGVGIRIAAHSIREQVTTGLVRIMLSGMEAVWAAISLTAVVAPFWLVVPAEEKLQIDKNSIFGAVVLCVSLTVNTLIVWWIAHKSSLMSKPNPNTGGARRTSPPSND